MNIVHCGGDRAAEWNRFVAATPGGSFYHRFEWKALNQAELGHDSAFLAATGPDGFTGVLPIVRVKTRLFGNIACSMPFVNYGGPCTNDPAVEKALIDEAAKVVDGWGSDYLEIRSRRPPTTGLPTSTHKVSLTVALEKDPEALFKRFKSGHRQEVRRAYKNGLTAKFGGADLLDDFYAVLTDSWHALGTPLYAKRYFQAIVDAFPNDVRICVVYASGQPAGAAFDGCHGDTVEGMWLGLRPQYRRLLVGYVLYWELIKDACERGYSRFHLGRSSAESSAEAFKTKWNAVAEQLYWSYILRGRTEMPQLNVDNPKFKLAIAAWRELPLAATRFLGPRIARGIP